MSKQIVLINGSGGVGKDTFVNYCSFYSAVCNISTVDKVKEAAKMLGWNGGKTEKDRKFLSDLKLLSVEYSDHSYNYIKSVIESFLSPDVYATLMFIHVREPEEIARFKRDFNCHALLIKNKNIEKITSNMADLNVDNFQYDFIINNDEGHSELRCKAEEFVSIIFKEDL